MKALVTAILLSMPLFSAAAFAQGKQDFTLVNKTGYDISEVYVSASKADDWEEDVMGRDVLSDGESVDISFSRGDKSCKWDLKVVYADDDSTAEWQGFDLCKVSKITILYNRSTGKTSAQYQ